MNVAYTSTTLRPRLPRTQRKPVHITSRVKQPRGRAPVQQAPGTIEGKAEQDPWKDCAQQC